MKLYDLLDTPEWQAYKDSRGPFALFIRRESWLQEHWMKRLAICFIKYNNILIHFCYKPKNFLDEFSLFKYYKLTKEELKAEDWEIFQS